MKDCLKQVAKQEQRADKELVRISVLGDFEKHAECLYSALKHLTEEGSAARRVVTSTPGEDGYTAWWNLNSAFTQALAARQGLVMSQLTANAKPSKIRQKLGRN